MGKFCILFVLFRCSVVIYECQFCTKVGLFFSSFVCLSALLDSSQKLPPRASTKKKKKKKKK